MRRVLARAPRLTIGLRLDGARGVRTYVRLAILLLLVLGMQSASADVGAGFIAQATRYGDQPNRNLGATLQLSLDRGDWQHFTELGVLSVSLGEEVLAGQTGTMWRGGLGTRYLARRLTFPRLDIVLGFEVLAALQHVQWASGGADTRPELAAGFTWTLELFHRIAYRTSVRAFVVPSRSAMVACRGTCSSEAHATSGIMVVTGVAW